MRYAGISTSNESSYELPRYILSDGYNKKLEGKKIISHIGEVKDCGDGFMEYVQYLIGYDVTGSISSIELQGHAMYYIPEIYQ